MKTITKIFLLVLIFHVCFAGCGEIRNSNEVPVDIEIETAPDLDEVTAVSDPGNDTSPNYTFTSTEVGTITYGGSCSAGITSAASGSNTITLNALSEGTYSDCTIIVTDTFGNISDTLTLTTFEIDTTSPTVSEVTTVTDPTNDTTPNVTFSSNESGTASYGGSCSSSTTSVTSGNNTVALKGSSSSNLSDNTTYSDCTITVTDEAGNVSSSITLTSFTVDTTASTLVEVTAVTTPTNDTTPDYSFSSTQDGTITYGGSCSSDNTTAEASDNNTITLKGSSTSTLAEGTYNDCTITVEDNATNPVTLNISSFVIDTTAPTLSSTSPSDADNVTAVSSSISVTFSEEMDNITTNTSDTSCSGSVQLSNDSFSTCIQMSSSPSTSDNITWTLSPSDNLSFYDTYVIKVTTGAADLAGNNLASDNTTANGFTTRYFTMYLATSSTDEGRGVTTDSSGSVYVTGGTYGGLNSNANSGNQDIFLAKIDNVTDWTVQIGSSSNDTGRGVASGTSNNIYVTGFTEGGLVGYTNLGEEDIFLLKYNSSGTNQWTRQVGTSSSDIAHGVAVYSNSYIYVVGETEGGLDNNTNSGDKDMFLVQYNSSGTRQWTQQIGTTSEDIGYAVAVDSSNNVYVTGSTKGTLQTGGANAGSSDIFFAKYDSSGYKKWLYQSGTTSEDVAYGIAIDSLDNSTIGIYLTGYTKGDLSSESNSGNSDAFLVKYYDNGTSINYRWTTLLGTTSAETGRSVAVNSDSTLYLTGDNGSTDGDYDSFLAKYNSSGTLQWETELKSDNSTDSYADFGYGVATYSNTFTYAIGNTGGDIDNNTNSGLQDVYLFKYADNGTKQ